ncbi:MAG: OprO/OprP family phosphate-selective porin [Planctomycetes bacterium]|nr:OprO/OprP family phosphate-selective porin [Planctomycetota bacterium]
MAKFWFTALALLVSAGLWAAPAMANSEDASGVENIQRGGAEGAADTTLGSKGLNFETDGFSLNVSTRVQFRLTYQNEVANGNDGANGRDFINFRIRRAKTTFKGHFFQKEFQYKLILGWTHGAGDIIEVAYFRWAFHQYLNVKAGQDKLEWNWEEISSSSNMQFVDRSYVNEVFNQDYAKGITIDGQVGEDTPWLKYWVGIYNGVLAGDADYRNSDQAIVGERFNDGVVDGEMMLNLRLETHPLGEVARGMNDARGEDEYDKVVFAVGLGVNWMMAGFDSGNAGVRGDTVVAPTASGRFRTNQDTWAMTLDGHFRWHGLSVDVAYFWRHTEFHNRGANRFSPSGQADVGNLNDSGFTFEVAYFILPQQFNVGIRFNMLNAEDFWQGGTGTDTPRARGLRPDTTEIGISVNYYIHGDNLKLTFDILWVGQQVAIGDNFNPLTGESDDLMGVYNAPPGRVLGGGSLGSSESDHNDLWIVRLQLQWIF